MNLPPLISDRAREIGISSAYPEDIMDGDMLGNSDHQGDLSLDGFFNGFCCLVSRYIDGRSIRLCDFLGLDEQAIVH